MEIDSHGEGGRCENGAFHGDSLTKTLYTSGSNKRGIISDYRMTNSLMYIGNDPKLRFRSFRMDDATGNKVDLMERM